MQTKIGHGINDWRDDGPRPSQGGSGVGWPLGLDSGQEAERVNAIDYEAAPFAHPLSPEFTKNWASSASSEVRPGRRSYLNRKEVDS